ncbi:MAG TPA: hypothetical protein PLQ93_13475, partial [Bacteroidia bacterium]|nr:hypothetical protein [Bacteroidia bacterium]
MGRFLFFWFFLHLFCKSSGQMLQLFEHRYRDIIEGMVCINHKSYYLERVDFPFQDALFLAGVNENGIPCLKKSLLNGNSSFLSGSRKILKTKDNHLLCMYRNAQSCDVGGNSIFMSKLDTNGNFIFTVPITLPSSPWDMTQYTDSTYYVLSSTVLRHYSKSGQFINDKVFTATNFYCLSVLNNGHLFLSNQTDYCEIDTAGNFIQIVPANTFIKKLKQTSSGKIFGLTTSGQLYKFSANFSILNQSQLPGITITDFVCRDDTVYLTGYINSNTVPYYAKMTANLNLVYQTSNTLSNILPLGIDLSSDDLVNISARSSCAGNSFARAYFRFPMNGDFTESNDVGVVSFTATQLTHLGGYFFNGQFDVEVRNYGNQLVSGFNLNSERSYIICMDSWQKWYDTILPPGSSVIVHTGSLNLSSPVW